MYPYAPREIINITPTNDTPNIVTNRIGERAATSSMSRSGVGRGPDTSLAATPNAARPSATTRNAPAMSARLIAKYAGAGVETTHASEVTPSCKMEERAYKPGGSSLSRRSRQAVGAPAATTRKTPTSTPSAPLPRAPSYRVGASSPIARHPLTTAKPRSSRPPASEARAGPEPPGRRRRPSGIRIALMLILSARRRSQFARRPRGPTPACERDDHSWPRYQRRLILLRTGARVLPASARSAARMCARDGRGPMLQHLSRRARQLRATRDGESAPAVPGNL